VAEMSGLEIRSILSVLGFSKASVAVQQSNLWKRC